MDNNETFQMTYSAQQQDEILSIRKKYLPPKEDKMQQLRALDAGVSKKATIVSIAVGVIGTLIMGIGMSLTLSDFGAFLGTYAFPIGIAIGIVGLAILVCAYPLYNRVFKREREKIAPEILRLTDELMQ